VPQQPSGSLSATGPDAPVLVTEVTDRIGVLTLNRPARRNALNGELIAALDAAVAEIDAGRCRVRMTADALEWPIMGLGLVGADFQVISPPELIEWMRDWGARFSRAAAGK